MNTLHLFAGIGGGIVADMLRDDKPVGAVELDPFCRRVLHQRQTDGWLPKFPIFKDVKEFSGDEIKKRVDCISGGFPCQSHSNAGVREGFDCENGQLFFDFVRIINHIRPPFVFLENVAAIIPKGGRTIYGELAKIGYHAAWTCLAAADCGAPHVRNRWWSLCWRDGADTDRLRKQQSQRYFTQSGGWAGDVCAEIPHADSDRCTQREGERQVESESPVAVACGRRRDGGRMWTTPSASDATRGGRITANMTGTSLAQQLNTPEFWPTPLATDAKNNAGHGQRNRKTPQLNAAVAMRSLPTPTASDHKYRLQGNSQQSKCLNAMAGGKLNPDWEEWLMGFPVGWTDPAPLVSIEAHHPDFWAVEPPIPRLTDITKNRVARVRALGNAQVPICAATAFEMLMQIISTQAPNHGG